MKLKQFSSVHWFVISIMCIGGLLLAGFTQLWAQVSLSQLAEEPLNLDVPMVKQSQGSSCGEAVIAMVYNYAYPATPITEAEVIEYAKANRYYSEGIPPYTSPANMLHIARHYANDVSTGTVISSGQGLSLLIQKLRDADPVIIDVLSNFRDPESEAHFIIITGLSVHTSRSNAVVVQYNDPLTGTKESADWAGSEGVWNAWKTNDDPGGSGWWLVISQP